MKGRKNNKIVNLWVVLLVLGINMSIVGTVAALTEIPAGATIDSATLSVYADVVHGNIVNVHRVTADWQENVVTWDNFGGYDPAIVGSFTASVVGSYSVNVTDLVQSWVDGEPNYGVLLEQGVTHYTRYVSSEHSEVAKRPKLEITYTAGGAPVTVTIQRTGDLQEDVADSYVWELKPNPTITKGRVPLLFSGYYDGSPDFDKYVLIRFDFTSAPPPPGGGGHTPGFWQNKNGQALIEAGDIDMLNALCLRNAAGDDVDFADKKGFKGWLKKRKARNMAYQLSGHLAAMKLNVAVGFVDSGALVYLNEDGDMISIHDLMDAAAAALCEDGYTPAGDENRDYQELLKDALDDANNNLNWVNP